MTTYYQLNRDKILKQNAENREARTEYNKLYYIKHKEKLDAKSLDRAQAKKHIKIECGCGAFIRSDSYAKHQESDKHLKAFETNTETICECGQRIWFADDKFKMDKHINNPHHQKWLNAKCEECLDDRDEVVIVLPDLILTDEEVGNDKDDEIQSLMEMRQKRNEYANNYYHLNKDKVKERNQLNRDNLREKNREYYLKNKQKIMDATKAYASTDRAKQMRRERDHKIITCECSWSGLNATNYKHKFQAMHVNWLKNKQ